MRRPVVSSTQLRLATAAAIASLVLLAVAAPVGAAAPPNLLRDINATGSSNPHGLTQVGGTVFFAADDGIHGGELWRTDGTAAGTVMVKDIRPGRRSSKPTDLTAVAGTLFFVAKDGTHGRGLWKSDGTTAGTVPVKQPSRSFAAPGLLSALGSRVFFMATNRSGWTPKVWVSDGTAVGTHVVYDATEHTPQWGLATSTKYFFITGLGKDGLAQLWWTDGVTTKQVSQITGIDLGTASPTGTWRGGAATVGRQLFVAADGALWKTDGTSTGTKKLLDGDWSSGPKLIHALGQKIVFLRGVNGNELWVSDGTKVGTQQIYDVGDAGLNGATMTTAAGQVFIARGWEHGGTIWRTNGTNLGTQPVGPTDFAALPTMATAVGDELCFAVPNWDPSGLTWALWESDGKSDTEGTYSVGSFQMAYEGVMPAAALNGMLIFNGNDGVHGVELWSYTP